MREKYTLFPFYKCVPDGPSATGDCLGGQQASCYCGLGTAAPLADCETAISVTINPPRSRRDVADRSRRRSCILQTHLVPIG